MRFLILFIVVLLSGQLAAQQTNDLTVLSTNYQPYNYQNNKREPDGHATKMVQALLTEIRRSSSLAVSDIEFLPWARTYHLAETTPDTLIFSIARTPEREAKFNWIGKLLPMPVYLYKNAGRNDVVFDKLQRNEVWAVAGVNNGAPTNCIEEMGYRVVHKSANYEVQFKMLDKGRVDLMVFDSISFAQEVKRLGYSNQQFAPFLYLPQCSYDLYVALNKDSNSSVVEAVQTAWQTLSDEGALEPFRAAFEETYQPFH
ncbi:hypothetical protein MACH26_22200 [Planctobacterium marinum]|uniref:Solute-binding protein family 3/N-terminal domain-containing protein n=2 Tax=Planctobacterium marinum TaxID=1631968 RepID=A0AA48HK34_9ALTE|nr:hypothetical protein MACH26_22200 [Planctobacterium marinum]